jgi:DNA repair protein RadA/Sms
MHEETETPGAPPSAGGRRAPQAIRPERLARPIATVPLDEHRRAVTGLGELDRVLGGGFVPGAVVLVGGEPGAGKSTLLLQAAHALAGGGRTVLYVSAEESPGQVRLRAERLGALHDKLLLASETELSLVLGLVAEHAPDVLVLDSIQTVSTPGAPGGAGSIGQVRECSAALVAESKRRGMATVLVGHVTKDGHLAGPRVLEHLVDAVCEMSGDRHHALRLLRAVKNRFGPTGEVGCFEMTDAGMRVVSDPGRLFVGEAQEGTSGVALTLTLEGERPLACEVQALVSPSNLVNPRRVGSGVDSQRLALLLAVLERRADVQVGNRDAYVSSVGGVRLVEPAVDLAICLAVASSQGDRPVARGVVALGEVGLAGEVRLVAGTERRLSEAARLGFGTAVLSGAYDGPAFGLHLLRVRDLREALRSGLS